MTEQEARQAIHQKYGVSREKRLAVFVELLIQGTATQNLISAATEDHVWVRHILDSAQLIDFAPASGTWVDIGTGAGLPGLVVAILRDSPITLVEPRRRRVEFLERCVETLNLNNVTILQKKVEATKGRASVISARAVGSLSQLFASAADWADNETIWVLPRGQSGKVELESVRPSWHGEFHVKQSQTSPDASILVARGVRPR